MSKKKKYGITAVIVIIIAAIAAYFVFSEDKPGPLDSFAQCIKNSGTIFYGAYWCPHCQNQKKMFGSSQKYLPYVECSTPSGKGQTQECDEKGIKGYPTWTYPDNTSESGEISLSRLSEKTGCALPQI